LVKRQSLDVISKCDVILSCSGTITLEATLLGVPMVVMYRVSLFFDRLLGYALFYRGGWPLFSLPNRLLKRRAIVELMHGDATSVRVAEEGLALLRNPEKRAEQCVALAEASSLLGPSGAIARAADLAEEMLDVTHSAGSPPVKRRRLVK
jgi:lipid-A-disaccharide synthase